MRLSMGLGLQMCVLEGLKEGFQWRHIRSLDQQEGKYLLMLCCMFSKAGASVGGVWMHMIKGQSLIRLCPALFSMHQHIMRGNPLKLLWSQPSLRRDGTCVSFMTETCSTCVATAEQLWICAGRPPRKLTKLEAFISGGLARAVAAAATCPFTLVKTRMENTGGGQPVQVEISVHVNWPVSHPDFTCCYFGLSGTGRVLHVLQAAFGPLS